MRSSALKGTSKGPLSQMSNFTNTVSKSLAPMPKGLKTADNFRPSIATQKIDLKRPSSVKQAASIFPPSKRPSQLSTPITKKQSLTTLQVEKPIEQSSLEVIPTKTETIQPAKLEEEAKDSKNNLRTSELQFMMKDHEKCLEKQRELMTQFKLENEMQSDDITKLRNEISKWKEMVAKSEADIIALKERNLALNNTNLEQDGTILNLRREIILLQRKYETCHESVAMSQLDLIKLKRDVVTIKGENEELRATILKEKTEKEAFWNQLKEENRKYQSLLETNSQFKEESKAFVQLVERMRDEIKSLRQSNEDALRFIMDK